MAAYIVGFVKTDGSDAIAKYLSRVPAIHEKYGATIICFDNNPTALEEDDDSEVVVLLEFKDKSAAEAYWHSEEYQEARRLRVGHATVKAILIDNTGELGDRITDSIGDWHNSFT